MEKKIAVSVLILLLVSALVLLAKGLTLLFVSTDPPDNPFTDFKEVLPGESFVIPAYDCNTFGEYVPPNYYGNYYCTPDHSTIKAVYIAASPQDRVIYTSFRLHPGVVTIGDLMTWYPDLRVEWYRFTNIITNQHIYAYVSRKNYDLRAYILFVSFRDF